MRKLMARPLGNTSQLLECWKGSTTRDSFYWNAPLGSLNSYVFLQLMRKLTARPLGNTSQLLECWNGSTTRDSLYWNASLGSLNSYVFLQVDGKTIGQHLIIVRVLKGVYNKRLPLLKCSTTAAKVTSDIVALASLYHWRCCCSNL